MSAVWVVRPPVMTLQWPVRYFNEENIAREVLKSHHEFGIESTISRETLLTPAHAAVIALVNRLYEHHACIKGMGNEARLNCWDDLMQAAATLRKQEGA